MKSATELSVRSVLESSTLLNPLSEAQMVELATHSKLKRCPKGELIWIDGSMESYFGLVGSGFVKLVKTNHAGTDVTLEIMGPGQIFGLMGTIDGSGCPLSAYALTDTNFLRIPKEKFLPIYEENHPLKDHLIRRASMRLHQKLDFMARLSTGSAEQRICAILFILADSYGRQEGTSIRLEIPLTRQQIGEMAGTTTETTIRVTSRWSQQGLISTDHQHITILDVDSLEDKLA